MHDNIIVKSIKDINSLLTRTELKKGIAIIFLVLLGSIVDVVGLAAIVPVMTILIDNSFIHENSILLRIYEMGAFTSDTNFLLAMVVGVFGVFLLKNIIVLLVVYIHSTYSYNVATDLSRRQFIKFYNKDFQFFKNIDSAVIVSKTTNMPIQFSTGILLPMIILISELMVMAFIFVGILMFNTMLFFSIIFVIVPPTIIIFRMTKNKLHLLGELRNKLSARNLATLQQAIFGYVDVKLTNKEAFFLTDYINGMRQFNNIQRTLSVLNTVPQRVIEVLAVLGIVVMFTYAVLNTEVRDSLIFFVSLFAVAAFRIMPSMSRVITSIMSLKSSQSVVEWLTSDGMPISGNLFSQNDQLIPFVSTIEFSKVWFNYSDMAPDALKNISFKVKKGEKVGIIGSSGSGKTTLINILLGFLIPYKGQLLIDGQKLTTRHLPEWRKQIGYVQQEVYLINGTLKENIAFGEHSETIDEFKLKRAIEHASLREVIENLPNGTDTLVGERGTKLSGGQRQRIGIARALYKGAEVLIFDEATSALDMETEREITEAINNLSNINRTLFIIAHRLTTLKSCDWIIELENGEMVSVHNYEQLIRERIK